MKRLGQSRSGLSLLETVLAIGIIMIALVGALTLIIATINAGSSSINRFLAVNLAREGIEAARQRRDTNWLKLTAGEPDCDGFENGSPLELNNPCAWDSGLTGQSGGNYDFTATAVFAPADVGLTYPVGGVAIPVGAWYFDFSPDDINDASALIYRHDGPGPDDEHAVQWPFNYIVPAGEQATNFRRLIHFNPICRDTTPPAAPDTADNTYLEGVDGAASECAAADTKIGTWVVSEVQWNERGRNFSVKLEERLYRWQ